LKTFGQRLRVQDKDKDEESKRGSIQFTRSRTSAFAK
jgi:hypothetical protein